MAFVGLMIRGVAVSCAHASVRFRRWLRVALRPRVQLGVLVTRPGGLPLLAEGETEAQWLRDTGLWELLGGRGAGSHPRGLLSTLTQTQAAAVRRRLHIYTRSARRRRKAPVRDVRDVRDVFGGLSAGVSARQGDRGPACRGHGYAPEGRLLCAAARLPVAAVALGGPKA